MTELQTKRDARTRADLHRAAMSLFAESGYDRSTMADVAAAAGVSRRTAYRHYAKKEDLLLEGPRRWLDVLDEHAAQRSAEEPIRDFCRRAVLAVAGCIEADRLATISLVRIMASTPALDPVHARFNRYWFDRYQRLIGDALPRADQYGELRSSTLAGALMGGTDGALLAWAQHPDASLVEMTRTVLDQIDAIWPAAAHQPPE